MQLHRGTMQYNQRCGNAYRHAHPRSPALGSRRNTQTGCLATDALAFVGGALLGYGAKAIVDHHLNTGKKVDDLRKDVTQLNKDTAVGLAEVKTSMVEVKAMMAEVNASMGQIRTLVYKLQAHLPPPHAA